MKYFEIPLINLRTRCCESAASETVYVKACEERWRNVYSVILVIAMRSALGAEWPVAPHVLHTRYGHVRRASFLAMPGLRAQRTVMRALFLVSSMRLRSTVSTNHRVCDPMMIRFSFSYFSLLCSGLAWTSAARPLTYLRSGLARTSAARPFTYLLPAMLTCDDESGTARSGSIRRIAERRRFCE